MHRLLSKVLVIAMHVTYTVIKPFTRVRNNKVLLLGRYSDTVPLDFKLLSGELRKQNPDVEIVILSRRFEGRYGQLVSFIFVLFMSLYHLATTKVCVLDSYWPAVSTLKHKPELVVYQLWHSLGKVKQSGRQAVGKAQGRSATIAQSLRMHEGYNYVVAGAEVWNPFYTASFGVDETQILNIGLPRADYLIQQRRSLANRILKKYPELKDKPIVLYAPTFRRANKESEGALNLAKELDLDKYNLVVKAHKHDSLLLPPEPHHTCPAFSGLEMLAVADYLITDYSSIALEAALIDVKTFYYLYDYDDYLATNGLNINLPRTMPNCVFDRAVKLAQALDRPYPDVELRDYKKTYIFKKPGQSTQDLVQHIYGVGGLCSNS